VSDGGKTLNSLSQSYEQPALASSCLFGWPSALEQFGCHLKNFREIWFLSFQSLSRRLNPSLTDCVQNVPRPEIFSAISRRYRQSYQCFCLFISVPLTQHFSPTDTTFQSHWHNISVPLTQHNHHSAFSFYVWCVFFQTHLYHFVPMLVKMSKIRVLPKLITQTD
jgi:hypothetical protein